MTKEQVIQALDKLAIHYSVVTREEMIDGISCETPNTIAVIDEILFGMPIKLRVDGVYVESDKTHFHFSSGLVTAVGAFESTALLIYEISGIRKPHSFQTRPEQASATNS